MKMSLADERFDELLTLAQQNFTFLAAMFALRRTLPLQARTASTSPPPACWLLLCSCRPLDFHDARLLFGVAFLPSHSEPVLTLQSTLSSSAAALGVETAVKGAGALSNKMTKRARVLCSVKSPLLAITSASLATLSNPPPMRLLRRPPGLQRCSWMIANPALLQQLRGA